MEANERHVAGERILSALEDLTGNAVEVRISVYVNQEGDVGWTASAVGPNQYAQGFSDSIEGALVDLRDNFMSGPKEIER